MVVRNITRRWIRMPVTVLFVLAGLVAACGAGEVKIPLSVRSFSDRPVPPLPVWTGVPLPRAAVKKADSLRLLGPDGKPAPAQFDVQATWSDGSVKWVLVSFIATPPPARRRRPEWTRLDYVLTDDASVAASAPAQPVRAIPDTNDTSISTGPLRILFDRHGFRGISQAWLDINGDGQFLDDEMITNETNDSGLTATDVRGRKYSSALGVVRKIQVERSGPIHAVVGIHGDLRSADSKDPLLNYAMRVHAFAGSSLVRVVLTIHNPRASGRPQDGSRWVLGQSGCVLLKSLEYVQPVRFAEGLRRATLATERPPDAPYRVWKPQPGRIFDRIPLTGPMSIYQDSSGGENWFHRTHVDKDNVLPLRFRGYKVHYRGREIHRGLRASPWVDVADLQWAVSLAAPAFWENFPKALAVDADGTIRLGLWPERTGAAHEIQGGEQKTHEFWLYFRHRRRTARQRRLMPLARELMPACLTRPVVWAADKAYAEANVTDPIVPLANGRFEKYEATVAAAVRDSRNLFTHREQVDEYGWRNFGDTWAANEGTKTQGPYTRLGVVSHYNNEYDLGLGMLTQAMRTVDADPQLARAWWKLGMEALWHEADIDIYHTRSDPAPIYNGGTFTHTAHGVEAGRSTHRGSPRNELWGKLNWPWKRGSTPEAGHSRNRGILMAYLLTGDRHLLDAANDMRDLVVFKVGKNRFAQITTPNRSCGNNIQILLDAYLLSWDEKYLKLCDKCAAAASFDSVTKRTGRAVGGGQAWQYCLFLKSLGRLVEAKAEGGKGNEEAVESFLKYSREVRKRFFARRGRWREGSWSLLACEVMMQAAELTPDAAERKEFVQAARAAFGGLDSRVREDGTGTFYNSKSTTMLLQGGGRYMRWALENPAGDEAGGK